jgi:hypothetical protein
VTLPEDPPTLGYDVFAYTSYAYYATLMTIRAPDFSRYTAAVKSGKRPGEDGGGWGVSVDTPASGNTGTYGYSHKRIVITDQ